MKLIIDIPEDAIPNDKLMELNKSVNKAADMINKLNEENKELRESTKQVCDEIDKFLNGEIEIVYNSSICRPCLERIRDRLLEHLKGERE